MKKLTLTLAAALIISGNVASIKEAMEAQSEGSSSCIDEDAPDDAETTSMKDADGNDTEIGQGNVIYAVTETDGSHKGYLIVEDEALAGMFTEAPATE